MLGGINGALRPPCRVICVSELDYRLWRERPNSAHARTAMKVLAHIREQYSLSLGGYGCPRMTMELNEAGLVKAKRRVGRLMRMNGIKPVRTRRHKITTGSNRRLGVPTNWLDGHFCRCYSRPKVERRCFLCLDCGGLALPCRYTRSAQSPRCRLSSQRPYEERPRDKGTGQSQYRRATGALNGSVIGHANPHHPLSDMRRGAFTR